MYNEQITTTNQSFTCESSVTPSPIAPNWVTSNAIEDVKIWRMNSEKFKNQVFFFIYFGEKESNHEYIYN